MFGYVRIFKPHMRFCEFDTYKAVYCGLCKKLGESYGFISRFTLSYDFTFLALMQFAINEEQISVCKERCIAHPLKKTMCLRAKNGVDFSASMAAILTYHKINDDLHDRDFKKKIIALFMYFPAKKAYKKAVKLYPELSETILHTLKLQSELEANSCKSIDMACEPSAKMMAAMASALTDDTSKKSILERFGYNIGRFVYICDAYDDLRDDFKKKNYNPFLLQYNITELDDESLEKITENAIDNINFSLAEIADCYVNLDIKKYKDILDNIIYLGLKNSFSLILKREKEHTK